MYIYIDSACSSSCVYYVLIQLAHSVYGIKSLRARTTQGGQVNVTALPTAGQTTQPAPAPSGSSPRPPAMAGAKSAPAVPASLQAGIASARKPTPPAATGPYAGWANLSQGAGQPKPKPQRPKDNVELKKLILGEVKKPGKSM